MGLGRKVLSRIVRRTIGAGIVCAAILLLALLPAGLTAAEETTPAITVYGAAGRVSGSLTVLETADGRWMIDCGAFYADDGDTLSDRDTRAARESADLPVEATSIKALFLTHAHLDHIGRVPLLLERGFNGPIYLTRATAGLAEPMLLMQVRFDRERERAWAWSKFSREKAEASGRSLYVHWRPCPYRQAISADHLETTTCTATELASRFLNQQPKVKTFLCPRCAKDEVASITRLFRPLEYDKSTVVAPGLTVTMRNAGHIPGSASILFDVATANIQRRILFSGDLGNELSPLFAGPEPAPNVDAVVLETTYGATRRDPAVANERAVFRREVGKVTGAGGIAWIPAFTLDRTQKILYELHLAQREGHLAENLPIYCPSPTAQAVTEWYRLHQQDGWFRPEVAADPSAWQPSEIRKTVPSYLPHPAIVISPNDMTTSLWSERLLSELLPGASTGVFLVGYQDPVSAGGLLERGSGQLTIGDQQIPVRAQVHSFRCFSGHGDAADIDRWLTNVRPEALVVLVHGDTEELQARAKDLKANGRTTVKIAAPGERIFFSPAAP